MEQNEEGADHANSQETIEQLPSEYIYTEMFKAMDIEQRGVITREDCEMAAKAAGWNAG